MSVTPLHSVDELVGCLRDGERLADEENVDLLAHGLQCAALLAARAPGDEELQIAGLVHDVGTALDPASLDDHAGRGGAAVAGLLGSRVARLVALHADAKRYLVTTDPAYRGRLSARSIETLVGQGGTMTDDEIASFRAHPELDAVVALRCADDDAKVPGAAVAPLDTWRAALIRVATRTG